MAGDRGVIVMLDIDTGGKDECIPQYVPFDMDVEAQSAVAPSQRSVRSVRLMSGHHCIAPGGGGASVRVWQRQAGMK